MKKNKLFIASVMALVFIISTACNTLFPPVPATPTSDYIFTPVTTPLKFEPDFLPNAQAGTAYEAQIRVSDNVTPISDVSISAGALPAGLELALVSRDEGIMISGTPEEPGTFTFTVFVSCFATMTSGQSGQKEYTIVVK